MIIGTTVIKRASYVNCRLPEPIKQRFYQIAKAKGVSASSYLLELILKELERENSLANLPESIAKPQN